MPRKFKTVFIDSLLWLQVNTDASLTRIANSASPWASKVCGNQWSLPIINPSTIIQNQRLLVGFPNLGAHDVIVLGTARLALKITLNSDDANRTVVQNLGRAFVKKTTIKISGNSDVCHCYNDLWKTAQERENAQYQGID